MTKRSLKRSPSQCQRDQRRRERFEAFIAVSEIDQFQLDSVERDLIETAYNGLLDLISFVDLSEDEMELTSKALMDISKFL